MPRIALGRAVTALLLVAVLSTAMFVHVIWQQTASHNVEKPGWVLSGKGDLRSAGGYVHAAIHASGSLPTLLIARLGTTSVVLLLGGEFVLHYLIDFTKAGLSHRSLAGPETPAYWTLHGADQLMHQMT